jgi:hypothetical protein
MNVPMSDAAAPRPLSDSGPSADESSMRERLGVAAFVLIAVVATASWIVLLAWGAIKLITGL